MKIKQIKKITALIAALLTFAVTSSNASTTAQIDATVKQAFKGVKTLEMPVQAAKLVRQTAAADKEQMAVAVVRTVIAQKPNLAASVVSAVAAVAPETAPAIVAEASKLASESAESVAVAAVKSAPQQSEFIIQKVNDTVPASSAKIASRIRTTMRSAATPSSGGNISTRPGVLRGIQYTPPTPPIPPIVAPSTGYDPARFGYQGP